MQPNEFLITVLYFCNAIRFPKYLFLYININHYYSKMLYHLKM